LNQRPYVLAIDQGTTNTKVVAVDALGRVVARASRAVNVTYPQPAWVELDATQVWQSVLEACVEVLSQCKGVAPVAVGVSNQRESVVAWDRHTGTPLGPVVIWQCRRTAADCESLAALNVGKTVHEKTGLALDPLFSATKMCWLLDHIPNGHARAEAGEIALGTIDSWLLWNLTAGAVHATDPSNASRTQLFGLRERAWLPELLKIFNVPEQALPQVKATNALFGNTSAACGLPAGVPIHALFADSHAALFAQGGYAPGAVKATYGTGSSLLAPTKEFVLSQKGISSTIAWQLAGQPCAFSLEGNIAVSGAAMQWLAQLLFTGDEEGVKKLARLAATVPDSEGVYLVPAFVGLGAPHWDSEARGLISGLTRGSTAAHVSRACLESLAYQVKDVLDVLEFENHAPFEAVFADGGASANDMLMQFQADILGRKVVRARNADLSAMGAAYVAGLGVGLWESLEQLATLSQERDSFEPQMGQQQRANLVAGWKAALGRARSAPA